MILLITIFYGEDRDQKQNYFFKWKGKQPVYQRRYNTNLFTQGQMSNVIDLDVIIGLVRTSWELLEWWYYINGHKMDNI